MADNRLAENATWNERFLGEQLKDLAELDLDFELQTIGFDTAEIDLLIEGLHCGTDDRLDELPDSLGKGQVSRGGDLWLLGEHRVLCANALLPSSFEVLMAGRSAHLISCDPPYNVKIDGHASGKGVIRHREFCMASGELTEKAFTEFLTQTFSLQVKHTLDGALAFVTMDWRHMSELLAAGKQVFSELKNLCVWAKDRAGMGSLYRSQHELVLVFKHGSAPHQNNIELGKFGRHRTNLWCYPAAASFGRSSDEGDLLALHPTVKPVSMIADLLVDCTARGNVVLDCFLGSGTTVIAAERTGRICFGMELDPIYVDVIVRRWQNRTGKAAMHAVAEKSFDEIESEVSNGKAR